jgi:hypothetical protein
MKIKNKERCKIVSDFAKVFIHAPAENVSDFAKMFIHAPAENRTRGPTMATLDFTTKPLALAAITV